MISDDEFYVKAPTLPNTAPMFGDEDSDSSDERRTISAARQALLDQENEIVSTNTSDENCYDVRPPKDILKKLPLRENETVIDYSDIINEDGLIYPLDYESPKKRKLRPNLGIFNLKKKKGYRNVSKKNSIKEKGISELRKDDKKLRDIGKVIFQQRKLELEKFENERKKCAILNDNLAAKHEKDEFQTELSTGINLLKFTVEDNGKKKLSNAQGNRTRKPEVNPQHKIPTTKTGTKKRGNVDSTTLLNGLEEKRAASAIQAADILENAAKIHEKKQKKRKIINMRRKKITDAPPIIRQFGDMVRMMVVLHVWRGSGYKQHDDDKVMIDKIIKGANIFLEMALVLGKNITSLCREFFEINKNTDMNDILEGLQQNTKEIYQRPTVRRVPNGNPTDPWSGEKLTFESIKEKASLILCPQSEDDASPCTIILPKNVPAFLSLIHGAIHLDKYIQNFISQALNDVDGLDTNMRWDDIWKKCAGETFSKKPTFSWPKGTKSRASNPFTNVVVTAREFIYAILFTEKELKDAIAKAEKN